MKTTYNMKTIIANNDTILVMGASRKKRRENRTRATTMKRLLLDILGMAILCAIAPALCFIGALF